MNTPRYIGLVWDSHDKAVADAANEQLRRTCQGSAHWAEVLSVPGVRVLAEIPEHSNYTCVRLAKNHGVVLGTLFRRPSENAGHSLRVSSLDAEESTRIVASAGQRLVREYWGRYVAVLHDPLSGVTRIVRDPMGYVRCLETSYRGVRIYFSNVEDCLPLDLPRFTINWKYIATHVVAPENQSSESGFNEITKVRPAECIQLAREKASRSFLWNPVLLSQEELIDSPRDAARIVRSTALHCIHSWASCHKSIIHRLSGGLDSSIVLGCLRRAPTNPKITCLNYYSAGSNSDERSYARLAAADAGLPLNEVKRNAVVDLTAILRARPSARPFLSCGYVDVARAEAEFAASHGATAYFTGGGGDQLFYQSPPLPAAADFARVRGVHPDLMSVALDIAQMTGITVWRVLYTALRDGVFRRRWKPFAQLRRYRTLVPAEIIERSYIAGDLLHPWLAGAGSAPPGKLWHIKMLIAPQDYQNPFARRADPEETEPLLASQPLVEACLRIPTYVLVKHGWDRSVARQAFAADVPRPILRRRSKGGMEEYLKDVLGRNLSFVRQLLLDGQLVSQGLLDRRRAEDVLSGGPSRTTTAMGEILEHVSTEAWLHVASNLRAA